MTKTPLHLLSGGSRLLVAHGLTRTFGHELAVAELNLAVDRGEVIALTGPNGSGKTTTLRLVAGLLEPTRGHLAVAAAGMAYVPAEGPGFEELTVTELLDLHARMRGLRGDGARAELLTAFGLADRPHARLRDLSTGLRRAVAVIAAAGAPADLLVIDEATAALDPESVLALREVIAAHAGRGGAVLLATQDLTFADLVAGRVVLLDRGQTVAAGSPEALRRGHGAGSLEEVFLTVTGRRSQMEDLRDRLRAG